MALPPLIHTKSGLIRGTVITSEDQFQAFAFKGIPYAEPPVGDLRFKKPTARKNWDGIIETTKFGPKSIQKDSNPRTAWEMSEDCLYLNVFTPSTPQNNPLPVIVFIHGGAYVADSCDRYGDEGICHTLVSKDVIVITVQYRVGFLGFWTKGGCGIPPNLALWDLILALNWVRENISEFGGDVNNITLMGQSAGAVLAELLSISSISRDLFHKIILMGGCVECSWAMENGTRDEYDQLLQGIPPEKTNEHLMSMSAEDFARAPYFNSKIPPTCRIGPTFNDYELFPRPLNLLRLDSPRKPKIIGVARSEGLLIGLGADFSSETQLDTVVDWIFSPLSGRGKNEYREMLTSENDLTHAISEAYGDVAQCVGVHMNVLQEIERGNEDVFLYSFNHFNEQSFGPFFGSKFPFLDATHTAENNYIFKVGMFTDFEWNENDRIVSEFTTNCWTNFAKTGDPSTSSVKWEPVTATNPQKHLRIKVDFEVSNDFHGGRSLLVARSLLDKGEIQHQYRSL